MKFNYVLDPLPTFTFEERQFLLRRLVELDNSPLAEADETLVEARLVDHHWNPKSSSHLDALKEALRRRTKP
jgi:hypothetical protein